MGYRKNNGRKEMQFIQPAYSDFCIGAENDKTWCDCITRQTETNRRDTKSQEVFQDSGFSVSLQDTFTE